MSYKSLIQHMNEALFETKYVPTELVNFDPRKSRDSNEPEIVSIIGTIVRVKIESDRQLYDIYDKNGVLHVDVEEHQIFQDVNKLLINHK